MITCPSRDARCTHIRAIRVDSLRSFLDCFNNLAVSDMRRQVEGCPTTWSLHVDVSPTLNEFVDERQVLFSNCNLKRCPPLAVLEVGVGSGAQQVVHHFLVVLQHCHVQRTPTVAVWPVHRNTCNRLRHNWQKTISTSPFFLIKI